MLHETVMFQRPPNKRFSGTSKYVLEIEIGISKSNCLLDGLYRNTFPLMSEGLNSVGK